MKKIVWAIDPFNTSEEIIDKTVKDMKAMGFQAPDFQVVMVYVLNVHDINWVGHQAIPNLDQFIEPALNKMDSLRKEIVFNNITEPKVIVNNSHSRRKSCDLLKSFCREQNAELIILNSHKKNVIDRFFLGSFTEDMVGVSDVSILVLNPKSRVIEKSETVFFPTDLSNESFKVLSALKHEPCLNVKKVVLYHKSVFMVDALMQNSAAFIGAGGGWVSVEREFKEAQKQTEVVLKNWCSKLERQGLASKYILDEAPGTIVDGVLESFKNEADFIVVNTVSSALESTLLGSVARKILRQAECPVWIIDSKNIS